MSSCSGKDKEAEGKIGISKGEAKGENRANTTTSI